MNKRISHLVISILAVGLLQPGCSEFKSLEHFAFSDQKAQAQKKWDSVRSDVKLQLVRQHLEAGRLNEAEKLLDQVIALSPHDVRPYVLATRLRLEQGKLAEAKEAILIAQSLAGGDPETLYYSGIIAQRYGFSKGALIYYRKAADAAPRNPKYLCAQAEMLLALDRPSDALQLIDGRLRDFDSDVNLRVMAARISRKLELRGPAIAFVRDAAQLAKDDRSLALQLAEILDWAGANEELIDLLSPFVGAHPEMPASNRCMLVQAYIRTSRLAQATEVIKPLLANEETAAIGALISAQIAVTGNNMEEAARTARLAVPDAQRQKSPEPFLILALASLKMGDATKALEMAKHALELDKKNISALCLKGQSHEALGQTEEARWSYLDALAIDPKEDLAKALLDNLTRKISAILAPSQTTANAQVRVVSGSCSDPCEHDSEGP